mmetsp:Transcript_95241/g.269185  ORF Transcript_95241/g.269185 Transcript_95241/m.269185 type:complete len:127 (+) Transcript_95241:1145-1525(+)
MRGPESSGCRIHALKMKADQATPFVVTFAKGTAACASPPVAMTYIGMYKAPPPTPAPTARAQQKNATKAAKTRHPPETCAAATFGADASTAKATAGPSLLACGVVPATTAATAAKGAGSHGMFHAQ